MRQLPRDSAGRPVPWFVAWIDGVPDFRISDDAKLLRVARGERLCWVCGQPLRGSPATFVVGPMCVVNGVSSEPPNHEACAVWSAQACPFLTLPAKKRRDAHLPDGVHDAAGVAIQRNPGVTALVHALRSTPIRVRGGDGLGAGILFRFSGITRVRWMAEGRDATADEVVASLESGLPALADACDGVEEARRGLARRLQQALRWLPVGGDVSALVLS
jgi:hypothetical protein